MQDMVVPCSNRSTQHECLYNQPEGPPMICAIQRYSLLMWNNHTAQLVPCLAQIMGGWLYDQLVTPPNILPVLVVVDESFSNVLNEYL